MKTIEVIPAMVMQNPQGHRVSVYGAHPGDDYKLECVGWTWRITDARGNVSVGLGRKPAATKEEAEAVAAERSGIERVGA